MLLPPKYTSLNSLFVDMYIYIYLFIFTFMHLADAFIQSDLQLHSGYTFSLLCVHLNIRCTSKQRL